MLSQAKKTISCPICKKKIAFGDPNMPFCSERCRVIDLANWADEKYVISTPAKGNDPEEEFRDGE